MLFINIALALIMFGVALGIKTQDFKEIVKHPKSAIIGFLSQFLFLPAVTFLIIFIFRNHITTTVAMGMILVAACPGGNISNFMTSFSKGNAALSVSLTAVATLVAVFLTPANFAFWGELYASSSDLVRPIKIPVIQVFKTVFILLGIPLILGMFTAWKFPKLTQIITKPIRLISILIFLGLVIGAFLKNYDYFIKYIQFIFILVLLHNFVAFATGYLSATIGQLKNAAKRTLTIETGIQNSGLALALILNPEIFPEENIGGMAFVTGWWAIWHIISGLTVAGIWSSIPLTKKPKSQT